MRLPELPDNLWESSEPPLERWWNLVSPNWEQPPPQQTYYIWWLITGLPCTCKLCGATDRWVLENEDPHIQVFICEHQPIEFANGYIRQIDTVARRNVGRIEVAHTPDL